MQHKRPYIVALGGAIRPSSSTERALRYALSVMDADTVLLTGDDLALPMYAPDVSTRTPTARGLIEHLRLADGVLIGSPAYHGGVSGAVKNLVDYIEDMRGDRRPYLSGRAVGCVVTAAGVQAAVTTLTSIRSIVHSLRGWPTPLGVCITGPTPAFSPEGDCISAEVNRQICTMAHEVVHFARLNMCNKTEELGEEVVT